MKVLLCAPTFPPEVGGVQVHAYQVAGGLARRGHRVRVLARSPGHRAGAGLPTLSDPRSPRGARRRWFYAWGRSAPGRGPSLDPSLSVERLVRGRNKALLYLRLFGEFFSFRPDLILLTHRAVFLRPSLWVRARRGTPLAVVVHGNELYGEPPPRRAELVSLLARADAIVAVSSYGRERLLSFGLPAERVHTVPNGVDPSRFDLGADGRLVRERLGLGGGPLLLTVGRLVPVKGLDVALRAFARVRKEIPRCSYLIVGEGPEEGALRRLATELGVAEGVRFVGSVPYEELGRGPHAYYQASDVFLLPGREVEGTVEAFGMAFLEAALCGKPSVAGRAGGSADAVREGETGLLVDGRDPGEVASAVLSLLRDPERARRMGEAGRRWVLAERTWEKCTEQLEAVLEGVRSAHP